MVNGKQHSVWFVPTGMKGLPQNVLLNFRLEFPKSDLTIYLPSGTFEIFCQMVSTPGFFFFASLLLCLPKTDYGDEGRDHNRRLESRGCERLLCDTYWENLAASSKKSIQYGIHCGLFTVAPLLDLYNRLFCLPPRYVQGGRCRGVLLYSAKTLFTI